MLVTNKRGILPHIILVFTLLTFGASLYFFNESMENQKGYLGEVQFDIIDTFSNAKKNHIYDEQVLKQNLGYIIQNFTNSGLSAYPNGEYTLWKKGDFECYPADHLKDNFEVYILTNLQDDFKETYDYDLFFENGGMTIYLKSVEIYSIVEENYFFNYTPENNISSFYNYSFDSILVQAQKVRLIVEKCGDNESCWENDAPFSWFKDNNIYKFEIVSNNLTGAFGEKEVILKAAVDFSPVNPLVDGDIKCLV